MADKERDEALREMAANRGCKLVKSRRRKPGGDFGRFGLADRKTGKQVFGFSPDGLAATAEEIEQFLRGSAATSWKSSLAASAKSARAAESKKTAKAEKPAQDEKPARAPKSAGTTNAAGKADRTPASARPRRSDNDGPEAATPPRTARKAEVPSEPPPLRIRSADSVDSEAIALLLTELGYETSANEVAERLQRLARGGEPALVARQGDETLGCLTWHSTPNIHRPWPVGRITMMVVTAAARRRGIGRALVEAAEERMTSRGCGLIEVTSNVKLRAAHAFYQGIGFERTSQRFAKPLVPKGK